MQQQFRDFLKDGSRYYRALVQKLVLHYRIEHNDLAKAFDAPAPANPPDLPVVPAAPDVTALALRVCHFILIHLGDLARYKELHVDVKGSKGQWGPALGYYQLARKLLPEVGMPMNQLAVVAIYKDNLVASTYYFLRAATALESFPTSEENLKLGFQKLIRASQSNTELTNMYLEVIGRVFTDSLEEVDIAAQLKNVSEKLSRTLRERLLPSETLVQLGCIPIAAGSLRRDANKVMVNQLELLSEIAMLFFGTMLDVMIQELATFTKGSQAPSTRQELSISAVLRQMLPCLRVYSKWLKLNVKTSRAIWTKYIQAMTLCGKYYPRRLLSVLNQSLEEDIELRGFVALAGGLNSSNFRDHASMAHANDENLLRVSDLLNDAASIAQMVSHELGHTVTTDGSSDVSLVKTGGLNSREHTTSHPAIMTASEKHMPSHPEEADEQEEQLVYKGRRNQ